MKTSLLLEEIEKIANPDMQAPWDKSGLQVASARTETTCLAVFLDPTAKAIATALEAGADFLLCHHPLTLKPHLPDSLNSYYQSLRPLMCADVALYAAHTSLDVNLDGPAGWLGRELELGRRAPLERIDATGSSYGYGEIGTLPEPQPFGKLVNRILKLARIDCANLAGPAPSANCTRVAYCGGSGGSLLGLAKAGAADLYITGDIKYHTALDAEIPVLDVGHHSLEEEMMRRLALLLTERLPGLRVEFFPSQSPFRRAYR